MDKYVIKGGSPLVGEVEIGGAKNAALAILTAAIMTDEPVVIDNIPDVSDINVLLEAISVIGATVERIDRHTARINGVTIGSVSVDYAYIKKIRWRAAWEVQARGSTASGRLQHRQPADRPAPEGLPGTWCEGRDPQWQHCHFRGAASRSTYLYGYGLCRRDHQHHDGSGTGRGKHHN